MRDGIDGFLIEPGDRAALEDRLRRLAEDARLRQTMGDAARARILAEHTADARAAQLEQHLQAAIAQSGADRVIAAE